MKKFISNYVVLLIISIISSNVFSGDLPKHIAGKIILFSVIGKYNPITNPNADDIYYGSFLKNRNYLYKDLVKGTTLRGSYSYIRKKVNGEYIGILHCKSSQNSFKFSIELEGNSQKGMDLYKQKYGPNHKKTRMNASNYYIIN